ncbi:hypothetical protein Chor_001438 [Crotalus horridus]
MPLPCRSWTLALLTLLVGILLFADIAEIELEIGKHILKFLDAEKDISVLKGTLKPGDIIHYVFDRDSTMNVSQNLYALLPRTSPLKGKHYRTCAIVGNSGILLNSGCGKEIDTHSFVIR